jgi:hypothetical protein
MEAPYQSRRGIASLRAVGSTAPNERDLRSCGSADGHARRQDRVLGGVRRRQTGAPHGQRGGFHHSHCEDQMKLVPGDS